MAAEAELPSWSPADFLIHGEFCPIGEIELAIERARRHADATAALLLVADERAVLRTLCGCVPEGDPRVMRMRTFLQEASLLPRKRKRQRSTGLQDYIRSPRLGIGRDRFPLTAEKVLGELAAIAGEAGDDELVDWLSQGIPPWVPARLPDKVWDARLSTALLFFEPRRRVIGKRGSSVVAVNADVLDISARVSSTAHANVRRDDLIMKRLDDKLDPAEYISGSVDFEAAAKALVELAVEVSGSDVGACYLVDHSKKRFELKAPKMEGEFDRTWTYPKKLATDDGALAVAATNEHLTLHLPPGLAGSRVHPTGDEDRLHKDLIELATPLPGPLATPRAPAVGVLTVAKLSGKRPYGAYEIAVLRNVALRLALIATTTNTTQAAQMFARLSMRAARLPISSSGKRKRASTPPVVTLPDDVAAAVPAIEDALSTLGSVTRAGTATFRAALPSADSDSPHGLTLARVAGYPAHVARNKKHAFQPESEKGYNWCAVRSGEISNVPVVNRKDSTYSEHRKSTRSELSVPVYVEDRVVGVVNLESPVKHAFDAHVELAQAAAEHIGLAIANARLALSTVVQELATDVLRRAHQITHLPKELEEELDGLPPDRAKRLASAVDGIQEEVDLLRVIAPDTQSLRPGDGDLSFPALVMHSVDELDMSDVSIEQRDGPWHPHEPAIAFAIAKALGDILDNARRHSAEEAEPPSLQLVHDEWGGQLQDVLIIRTEPDEIRLPEQAINIYRCPLHTLWPSDDGEVDLGEAQLGAYLAGLQIRRAGGEVHLTYESGRQARVIVAVPSPNPVKRKRAKPAKRVKRKRAKPAKPPFEESK